jgi:DEAD/DEAH box helicase domain-containing protein
LKACTTWSRDYKSLCDAWRAAVAMEASNSTLNAIHYQAKALWQTTTISSLAEYRFLPRYGFPLGVQALTVQGDTGEEPVRFQRSSLLALSEYVAGSVLLGGGRNYTSHGILNFWSSTGDKSFGLRKFLYTCHSGHQWTELQPLTGHQCPQCSGPLQGSGRELLLPAFGYSTAAWDPPTWETEQDRIGVTQVLASSFLIETVPREIVNFATISGLTAALHEGAKLLATNGGNLNFGFAICTKCGFAESMRSASSELPRSSEGVDFLDHLALTMRQGKPCWNKGEEPVMRHQILAAEHNTDLLQVDLSEVPGLQSKSMAATFAHAMHLAAAELLEIDSREISLSIEEIQQAQSWRFQLYDSDAGGSGHMCELADRHSDLVTASQQVTGR